MRDKRRELRGIKKCRGSGQAKMRKRNGQKEKVEGRNTERWRTGMERRKKKK